MVLRLLRWRGNGNHRQSACTARVGLAPVVGGTIGGVVKGSVIQGTIIGALVGLAMGSGAYTFIYAKGYSYLTNDPAACANCHVMNDHYQGWLKSSHRSVATCNDCHTPDALIPKYYVKAENGFWHAFYFTTGN
jgi:cytochrome c nitrite reductase small subunit